MYELLIASENTITRNYLKIVVIILSYELCKNLV